MFKKKKNPLFKQFFFKLLNYCRTAVSESDSSSLNSIDLDGAVTYADSDTGLESMSSAETPNKQCSLCVDSTNDNKIDVLRQEVTRLKCDKLDLLRQNVVSIYYYYQKFIRKQICVFIFFWTFFFFLRLFRISVKMFSLIIFHNC